MNKETIVITEQLTKKYGDFTAVQAIDLAVGRGEVIGFLGANGAGKTTLLRMLAGLLRPSSGNATIAGFDIYRQAEAIKRRVGYMSQQFSLYEDLTVQENIRFFGGIYGLSRRQTHEAGKELLKRLDLPAVQHRLVHSLPLGWKQKLAFSIAMLHHPLLLLLDEPTSGVDPVTSRTFWRLIYETAHEGTTLFITTHHMDEAAYCDRVAIMAAGQLMAFDSPIAIMRQQQVQTMNEAFLKILSPGTPAARRAADRPR